MAEEQPICVYNHGESKQKYKIKAQQAENKDLTELLAVPLRELF